VVSDSVEVGVIAERVSAFPSDESGTPGETLFPRFSDAHRAAVKLPILHHTVCWACRAQQETRLLNGEPDPTFTEQVQLIAIAPSIHFQEAEHRCVASTLNEQVTR